MKGTIPFTIVNFVKGENMKKYKNHQSTKLKFNRREVNNKKNIKNDRVLEDVIESSYELDTIKDFINYIYSVNKAEALVEFGIEVQMIVFLLYRGYTITEISTITGFPRYVIMRKLNRLNGANKLFK